MTIRLRRPERGIRTRLGRLVETEERQQAVVTALFVAAIGLVLLILVGAVALAWYNDNVRPLARVGATEVGPLAVRDYVRLEQWRIARDEGRITEAQINGDLTAEEADIRVGELNQRSETLNSPAVLSDLVDLMYQTDLAAAEGIVPADAEVDARLAEEIAAQEQRRVQVIVVEPQAADATAEPTVSERLQALESAQEALAQIESGADWATVARQFGTDEASQAGGDLGVVGDVAIADPRFANEVFELEQGGTTGIIRGDDGAYRIGRVTEIVAAGEDPSLRTRLFRAVSEAGVRNVMRMQVASDALREKITDEALAQTPEQIRMGIIYIAGVSTGAPDEAEGDIQYSEIVYAPGDDMASAQNLDENDPAWTMAKTEADDTFAELQAITDVELRKETFAQLATAESDAETASGGGLIEFTSRSIPPVAISDALWGAEHAEGDVIGPVRGDAGWYVLMFQEKRESVETRLDAVEQALAQANADFGAVARELSEGPQAADGGEAGWFTRDVLAETSDPTFADAVFALQEGQVSEALLLGEGHYFVKALEREVRPLDPDQTPTVEATAFDNWYQPKREEAEANGTIVIPGAPEVPDDLEGGGDQP